MHPGLQKKQAFTVQRYYMKQTIYILILLVAFVSCRSLPAPTVATHKSLTDSTSTKITYQKQQDTFSVAADSLKVKIPIADLSDQPIITKSKSGRVKASVSKVDGNIEVQCFTDKYEKIIETQNQIIETLIKLTETTNTTETKTEFKSAWYMKALAFLGGLLLLSAGIMLGIKFIKPF